MRSHCDGTGGVESGEKMRAPWKLELVGEKAVIARDRTY